MVWSLLFSRRFQINNSSYKLIRRIGEGGKHRHVLFLKPELIRVTIRIITSLINHVMVTAMVR